MSSIHGIGHTNDSLVTLKQGTGVGRYCAQFTFVSGGEEEPGHVCTDVAGLEKLLPCVTRHGPCHWSL